MNALDKAIAKIGGVGKLAKKLGKKQSTVSNWRARGQVPADCCIEIETVVDGEVTRYDLRPDVFGSAPHASKAA